MNVSITLRSAQIIPDDLGIHLAIHHSLKPLTNPHDHDFYEIFLLVSGQVRHIANGAEEVISTNSLTFIRPEDIHYYQQVGEDDFTLMNLAFSIAMMQQITDYLGIENELEALQDSWSPTTRILQSGRTQELFDRAKHLIRLGRENRYDYELAAKVLLAEFFGELSTSVGDEIEQDMPAWILRLTKKISEPDNLREGLERLKALSHCSPEHLNRSFRQYLGESPTEYINRLRLEYVANLLISTNSDVGSIAYEAGYNNLSHFNHRFKRHYQMSPRNYRRQFQTQVVP
ncbi:MAG: AraC family transcriptional regulator [Candidatus Marinimicrobia bacterium]|nr:AraC family transcriptional regulator [Candidatus Neomarinimicrobiota bacterium]MCF7850907.1 AraC family transcriptional regulator [Candidatus Neomarinimicrobiota bacterium]MCF7905125.1 AraC family transcriptional regulator [Candidatus Neomarinimicrobiota bacterium]